MNKHTTVLYLFLSVFFIVTILNLTLVVFAFPSSLHYQTEISQLLDQRQNDPRNGKICNTIGFYYYKIKDYRNAVQYYLKAIELAPEYPLSYNNLGVVYLKLQQYEGAEKCFRKAIELDPEYIKAICNLGSTCFKMNNHAEAKKWYKIAKKLDLEYVNQRKALFFNKGK